ncbi:Hypothetical protein MexAM1_META1p2576 [Methylorubrum extorquens AM1]|uniref:Uncharacterized protein n=1 Tax=Methylorubrum extorquens (strain ATCC 14718 / DSM 1338 / JCM 2805 / NCIMB 9133 / AM1) TaxID=272630 RepID=C5ASB1_METEA|nr:Hypothetical protein MexAM1_META1p2576 [Methylorubrum extorquens AM1]
MPDPVDRHLAAGVRRPEHAGPPVKAHQGVRAGAVASHDRPRPPGGGSAPSPARLEVRGIQASADREPLDPVGVRAARFRSGRELPKRPVSLAVSTRASSCPVTSVTDGASGPA